MKKAQGLSLNMIIIAAIGIIVLVVVVILFSNQAGNTKTALNDCTSKGGREVSSSEECSSDEVTLFIGDETNPYCCIPLSS